MTCLKTHCPNSVSSETIATTALKACPFVSSLKAY